MSQYNAKFQSTKVIDACRKANIVAPGLITDEVTIQHGFDKLNVWFVGMEVSDTERWDVFAGSDPFFIGDQIDKWQLVDFWSVLDKDIALRIVGDLPY